MILQTKVCNYTIDTNASDYFDLNYIYGNDYRWLICCSILSSIEVDKKVSLVYRLKKSHWAHKGWNYDSIAE